MTRLKTGRAPGHPGAGSNWDSSRKSGVGCACNFVSRVWFTIGDGILNEIYYPRIDQPCTKDMGLLVTAGDSFFSEEKRDTHSEVRWMMPGVPAFALVNTHRENRYRIRKEIIADPARDVVLQRIGFEVLDGSPADYRLYAILAPHLSDEGRRNTAWFDSYKGMPMLFAESKDAGLAFACSTGWRGRSVGFVGKSDGWQDLSRHRKMEWHYDCAKDGNVAMTGEIHLGDGAGSVLAIGFGNHAGEAAQRVRAALLDGFDAAWERYRAEWERWHEDLLPLDRAGRVPTKLYRSSAAVLRSHTAAGFPGGLVASLSIPWGTVQRQFHAAGYHVVWARDCAQSAMALLALGAADDALRSLAYLHSVQEGDGHWPQAMWIDGKAYWTAIQIDSIAAPLLLFEALRGEKKLEPARFWPMVRKTARFICRNGPRTQEDRWEKNSGFSPYTLATAIAALVIAARQAEENHEPVLAQYLHDTADAWNAQIENWTYCPDAPRARALGLSGCYCRIVPASGEGIPRFEETYSLGNSELSKNPEARDIVSPDVWGLVRYGLRSPHDPRIVATTAVIDATLKTDTPAGPVWHRYNFDGYGENSAGDPFSKEGIGRAWPLLTGERAHYELAAGRFDEALRLLQTIENLAHDSGLLSEQVWDAADIPGKGLFFGRPTGSARPLAWAHAEHVQLLRSLEDRRVFSCPEIVAQRYVRQENRPRHTPWRFDLQTPRLVPGTLLRIETEAAAQVRWTIGAESGETPTDPGPVGLHYADLPTDKIRAGKISFTFYWLEAAKWEGRSFELDVADAATS